MNSLRDHISIRILERAWMPNKHKNVIFMRCQRCTHKSDKHKRRINLFYLSENAMVKWHWFYRCRTDYYTDFILLSKRAKLQIVQIAFRHHFYLSVYQSVCLKAIWCSVNVLGYIIIETSQKRFDRFILSTPITWRTFSIFPHNKSN